MLEVVDGTKHYRGPQGVVRALTDVSLKVASGEFVAVKGSSGSGKTTLLLAVGGLLQPDSGQILVNGQNVYAVGPETRAAFRASTIGFVFQQFHLVPYLSVLDNVLTPSLARPQPEARGRAIDLIRHFGLTERVAHVPAGLSTGERQRVALARALLNDPKLLLADEPTGNLDQTNSDTVLGYLAEFARKGGAVLMVTHSDQAAQYADRTLRLQAGSLGKAK